MSRLPTIDDDYLDRLGRELDAAARRTLTQGARRRPARPARLVAAVAALALAAPAVALTHPWTPLLGEPGRPHPTVTRQPPPRTQLDALAVLRRPQADADRVPGVRRLLRFVGLGSGGVRTAAIRVLGRTPGGLPVVLVPSRSYSPLPRDEHGFRRDARRIRDALCIVYPEANPAQGAAKACFTTQQVLDGHAVASLGRRVFGLVPDGRVTVTVRGVTAPVHDNFFDVRLP